MIPRTESGVHAISWQKELANAITNVEQLLAATKNDAAAVQQHICTPAQFPIRVPFPYIKRIVPGDINDPLLRQVLSYREETLTTPGYLHDPLQETNSNVKPGIIHKYKGRVLLVLGSTCAINCRYCFRRHFPYQNNQNSTLQWTQALDYIRRDSSISEVIYSGGDPLVNSDKKLASVTQQISEIDHVKRLRIHTRMPVVIPQRVTDELLGWLTETNLKVSMVLHINHANELDTEVAEALAKLSMNNVILLNQSVLLQGVNNHADALVTLSESLFDHGIIPYYLHLMDKVQHTAHYDTPLQSAHILEQELLARLPGYLVPKLVFEEPAKNSKTPLTTIT